MMKKISYKKMNTILFGNSPTMDLVKDKLSKSMFYNIVGAFDLPKKDVMCPYAVNLVIVSSDLFYNNNDAMEIISNQYLIHGCLLKTDLNIYETLFRRIPMEGMKNFQWIIRRVANREESYTRDLCKRAFDILFSLFMIIILMLPMAITWLLIKTIDGFDPIFIQARTGMYKKIIHIYKFRTMKPDTEEVTKLGSILRRFRIDEFLQLFAILKGDMSFVGPRPIYIMEDVHLNLHVPNHSLRTFVRPGLTGWAQLNFKAPPTYCVQILPKDQPDEVVYRDAYIRLSYDLWYIGKRSLFLDMKILLYTLKRAFVKDSSFKS